jgi:hypothetical protein
MTAIKVENLSSITRFFLQKHLVATEILRFFLKKYCKFGPWALKHKIYFKNFLCMSCNSFHEIERLESQCLIC